MKHTPGPWHVTGSNGTLAVEAKPHGMLLSVRYLGNAPEREAEERANAALAAEAPALAQALRDLRKELHEHIKFDVRKHYSLMVADAAAGTILHRLEA